MAKRKSRRRTRVYVAIIVSIVLLAVLIPLAGKMIARYFSHESTYYYPHDLERDEYLREREEKKTLP
jgi:hypothetical protein